MDISQSLIVSRSKKSRNSLWKVTLLLLILALFIRFSLIILSDNPHIVEKYYSSTIYPTLAKSIGSISGIVTFSIAEISFASIIIAVIIFFIYSIFNPKFLIDNIIEILNIAVIIILTSYILFYLLWGLNYYRMELIDIANLNKEPSTFEELKEFTTDVIFNLNRIREVLLEDENGVFIIDDDFQKLSQLAQDGFKNYNLGNLSLSGNYSNAKQVLSSYYMSYTGIMGIYIPFTFEPNVNKDIPYHNLLSTMCHEMAHQRGFAKEDEANFIAYKTSINNPDQRFQYSGYHLAFQYLMKDIYLESKDEYFLLYTQLSDAVKRDLDYGRDYWHSKESKAEKVATTMNDTYLKINNQKDGIKSYSGVVKLLLADYKNLKK